MKKINKIIKCIFNSPLNYLNDKEIYFYFQIVLKLFNLKIIVFQFILVF